MFTEEHLQEQNKFTLAFENKELEKEYLQSYDESVKVPLRYGIIISILSWFSAIGLIYAIIPDELFWFGSLTFIYIGSYFGFIVYATYKQRYKGYYHLLGAISNAWAGLYTIYFCDQFPNGENLILPVLIFIIFFGSYMVRLRWIAGFVAAITYIVAYHVYIANYADLTGGQIMLYAFVAWMTLIFAILAGRVAESNNRITFIQQRTILAQRSIIEEEKEILLKEVHHRVKNNLQIIVSLINLQLSTTDNDSAEMALKETQGRVQSMSLVHQRMKEAANFNEISFEEYTKDLIRNIQRLYSSSKINYQLEIPKNISVNLELAIPLGQIINEVITNFCKHCKAENSTSFTIKVTNKKANEYLIQYADNGVGFPNNTQVENTNSIGLELIKSLTDQIEGDFKFYNDNGAVYEILFKIENPKVKVV